MRLVTVNINALLFIGSGYLCPVCLWILCCVWIGSRDHLIALPLIRISAGSVCAGVQVLCLKAAPRASWKKLRVIRGDLFLGIVLVLVEIYLPFLDCRGTTQPVDVVYLRKVSLSLLESYLLLLY